MCPLSPPPAALFLPWPWQAPLNWIGFGLIVALIVWLTIVGHRMAARTGLVADGDRQPWWNHTWVRLAFPLASLFLILVVEIPSLLRSKAWFDSQFARFAHGNHDCSLTQLFVINAHQIQIVWAATLLAFALNAVSWPLIIVAARTAQRSAGMIGAT